MRGQAAEFTPSSFRHAVWRALFLKVQFPVYVVAFAHHT